MIPYLEEHEKSFVLYYYTYDISKAILDLDLALCQNFLFFITLSILHIQTCMMPLMKAELKGFIFFFLHLRAVSSVWGRYDPQTEKANVFASESFLHVDSSVMPLLKVLIMGFISHNYNSEL